MVTDKQIALMHYYKAKTPPLSNQKIAKELGVSRNTVEKYLKMPKNAKVEQLLSKMQKNIDKDYQEAFEMITDDRVSGIIGKILTGFDDQETIKRLLGTERGIQTLNNILGTLMDKARAYKEFGFKTSIAELEKDNNIDEGYNDNYINTMQRETDKIEQDVTIYLDPASKPS